MAKKAEETTMGEVVEKKEEIKKIRKIEFRAAKGKNFVGFTHPETRRFVTGNKDGKFFIKDDDESALKILREAADVVEI